MPDLSALLASVDEAHDEIVTLLQDLVRIPTINHGSRPDTGGETRACELLRTKLDEARIAYEVHESAPLPRRKGGAEVREPDREGRTTGRH